MPDNTHPPQQCGYCWRWTNRRECPREHFEESEGMWRGPSAHDIACDRFETQPLKKQQEVPHD